MMQAYRTEGNYRSAARLSAAELRAAMASHEILQATALAFDTQRQLRFDLGGVRAVMPFVQCADGAENGTVRDIAVLTRVGRPTCFVIEGMETGENGQPCYLLSRAEAQRMCKAEYLDTLQPGDILPDKMKIKLVIVNHSLGQSHRFDLRYFITEGHIDHWLYSTPESRKRIETDFAVAACNPV